MLAIPNFGDQIHNVINDENSVGSQELCDLYIDRHEPHELNYASIPLAGRSDYDGFNQAGKFSRAYRNWRRGYQNEGGAEVMW